MEESAERYRQYAQDCRRLAQRAAPKDKAVLLEIADAWDQCANATDAGSRMEKVKDDKGQSDLNSMGSG
jgi:hypothetical protein